MLEIQCLKRLDSLFCLEWGVNLILFCFVFHHPTIICLLLFLKKFKISFFANQKQFLWLPKLLWKVYLFKTQNKMFKTLLWDLAKVINFHLNQLVLCESWRCCQIFHAFFSFAREKGVKGNEKIIATQKIKLLYIFRQKEGKSLNLKNR